MSATKTRLRVLIVPEWHPWPEAPAEGSWGREQSLAVALSSDVAILTTRPGASSLRPRYELTDEVEQGLRTVRIRYSRSPFPKMTTVVRLRAMQRGLKALEATGFVPDIVHAKVFSAGFPALFLARRLNAPLVVSEHYTGFPRGTLTRWDKLIARVTFRAADAVCPDSVDLGGYLRTLEPRARIEPMPNVVDTDAFSPAEWRPPAESQTRLVNVASLHDKKGHEYLLRAVALLAEPHPDLTLDIVGDGPRRGELQELASELDVSGRVRFLGVRPKEEVAGLLRESDVFVLPSLWENAPHAVLEALATGLPVVATDVGGVSELVAGTGSMLVPPRDSDALATAISEVVRRGPSQGSHERAAHTARAFGHEHVGRLWTRLYTRLLEERATA